MICFKHARDARYEADNVVSHSRLTIPAHPVKDIGDILDMALGYQVVGIDEVQFFESSIIAVIEAMASRGQTVLFSGLDTDYTGKPFDIVGHLLCIAEEITKLHAICVLCGNQASMTKRLIVSEERIVVGGPEAYEARCRSCHSI